jgi:hypothetical protein
MLSGRLLNVYEAEMMETGDEDPPIVIELPDETPAVPDPVRIDPDPVRKEEREPVHA